MKAIFRAYWTAKCRITHENLLSGLSQPPNATVRDSQTIHYVFTKRKRRCGWFDAVLVGQSIAINGITDVVLTKLDVLDELEEIQVCVGYETRYKKYNYLPFDENIHNTLAPIYETIPGWQVSTFGLTTWGDLPKEAQNYISFLESKIQKNISIISTGPDRAHTIDRNNLLGNN